MLWALFLFRGGLTADGSRDVDDCAYGGRLVAHTLEGVVASQLIDRLVLA